MNRRAFFQTAGTVAAAAALPSLPAAAPPQMTPKAYGGIVTFAPEQLRFLADRSPRVLYGALLTADRRIPERV